MALCITALLFEAGIIPILAMQHYRPSSWVEAIILLVDVPTVLATATLLGSLREAFIKIAADWTDKDTKDFRLTPATEMALVKAQQSFYNDVKGVLKTGTIVKVVVTAFRSVAFASLTKMVKQGAL